MNKWLWILIFIGSVPAAFAEPAQKPLYLDHVINESTYIASINEFSQKAASPYPEFTHAISNILLDAYLRSYYFERNFNGHAPSQASFTLAGKFGITTEAWYGLSGRISYYTAQPLGLNSQDPRHLFPPLPGTIVSTLGEAFAEYHHSFGLVRLGDQLINTPWLNPSDTMAIPAIYSGFYGQVYPSHAIKLSMLRSYAFKGRIQGNYSQTNLYNVTQHTPSALPRLGNKHSPGAFAMGADFNQKKIVAAIWYYQFYDFANLVYGNLNYEFPTLKSVVPTVAFQAGLEGGAGKNYPALYGSGQARSEFLGTRVSGEFSHGIIALAYNVIPQRNNGFNHGDIVSPYTAGYQSDPLYTSSMMGGLVEQAPGTGARVSAQLFNNDKRLNVMLGGTYLHMQPYLANATSYDGSISYRCGGLFKGLVLMDRFGIRLQNASGPQNFENRIMVQFYI